MAARMMAAVVSSDVQVSSKSTTRRLIGVCDVTGKGCVEKF